MPEEKTPDPAKVNADQIEDVDATVDRPLGNVHSEAEESPVEQHLPPPLPH